MLDFYYRHQLCIWQSSLIATIAKQTLWFSGNLCVRLSNFLISLGIFCAEDVPAFLAMVVGEVCCVAV